MDFSPVIEALTTQIAAGIGDTLVAFVPLLKTPEGRLQAGVGTVVTLAIVGTITRRLRFRHF